MSGNTAPVACANCATTEGARVWSFDLDLPAVALCQICQLALTMGDEGLLADMARQGRRRR